MDCHVHYSQVQQTTCIVVGTNLLGGIQAAQQQLVLQQLHRQVIQLFMQFGKNVQQVPIIQVPRERLQRHMQMSVQHVQRTHILAQVQKVVPRVVVFRLPAVNLAFRVQLQMVQVH